MKHQNNILKFPSLIDKKKDRLVKLRDDIEKILTNYALYEKDLWAVSLAAGRFAAINLEKLENEEKAIEFFRNCIRTQRKYELTRNSSNIT